MSLTYCRQCGNMMLPPGSNQTDPEWLDCDNYDCVLSGVAQIGTSVDDAPNSIEKQLYGALERIAQLEVDLRPDLGQLTLEERVNELERHITRDHGKDPC